MSRLAASPRPSTVVLLLAAVIVPAVSAAQSRPAHYVAPTDATVTTRIEEGYGDHPSHVVWITNASTVPIEVYSVTLRQCENVRQSCTPTSLKLRVRPGHRELLKRVEPKDVDQAFGFAVSFGWRADSSAMAAMQLLADQGSVPAQERIAAQRADEAEQRRAIGRSDVSLGRAELDELGSRIVSLRAEPESIVVHVGQLVPIHQVRVLAIGAQGELLGRVRAYSWRVMRGPVTMNADTVVAERAGRTTAEFQLAPPAAPLKALFPIVVVADTTN